MTDTENASGRPQGITFQVSALQHLRVKLLRGQAAIKDTRNTAVFTFVPLIARTVFPVTDNVRALTFVTSACFSNHVRHDYINCEITLPETEMISAASPNSRPPLELADVFRASGAAYLQTQATTTQQRRVLRAIIGCRTAALGSHTEPCANCGQARIAYNSCRNRHCPKCQQHKQLLWTAQREAELLPIEYFHVVFTLPHQFNVWARRYPRTIYDWLFAAATQSLLELGRRTLGGELGITAVLHTWGQTLQQHLHLHCIVTGGALSADGERFQRARPGFLGSVEALSASYQQHYLRALQRWAETTEEQCLARELRELQASLAGTPWVVYAKRPMCGPQQVSAYLGRYTQRVAIGNSRLLSLSAERVRFR